jgi:hypothetical protein
MTRIDEFQSLVHLTKKIEMAKLVAIYLAK